VARRAGGGAGAAGASGAAADGGGGAMSGRRSLEVVVETGRVVPTWVLRVVGAVLVTVMLLVAVGSGWHVGPWHVAVAAAVACAVMLRPWTGSAALAVGVAGVVLLMGGPASLPTVMVLVLLAHAVLWVSSFAARASWSAGVEVAVLAGEARGPAVVQVGAQVLAVVAVLVSGADVGASDAWRAFALIGAIGLVAAVLPRPR